MMHLIRKTPMDLPCKLTEREMVASADAVSLALRDQQDLIEVHKARVAAIKQEKMDGDAKLATKGKIHADREELRIVDVLVIEDHQRKEVYFVRTDTGDVWNVKPLPRQERIDHLSTDTQPSEAALDAIERHLATRGADPEDPAVEASLTVYDKLVALDHHQDWPSPGAIEGWTAEERLSVLAWAETRRPGEVAPDVLKTWMATHDEPEPSPAAQVKAIIHQQGDDLTARADLRVFFDDAALAQFSATGVTNGDEGAKLDRVLWALVHTNEIGWNEAGLYSASRSDLTFDVDRMLAAQPQLGTEEGLPEEEIVWIDLAAPESDEATAELVDLVLGFVKERDRPTTKLDIMTRFDRAWDADEVKDAIDQLYSRGDLQEVSDGFWLAWKDAEETGGGGP